jgi:hypothetical protein
VRRGKRGAITTHRHGLANNAAKRAGAGLTVAQGSVCVGGGGGGPVLPRLHQGGSIYWSLVKMK